LGYDLDPIAEIRDSARGSAPAQGRACGRVFRCDGGRPGNIKLYQCDPKRIVPILRPYRTRENIGHWWQDPSVIPYLESRLALKVHKGIGEFHLFGGQTGTPVIKQLIEIVLRENIYLHAHSDEVAIVELFNIEPRLKVIWAHAGMSSGPQAVGALLDRYPNLSVDLAIRNGDSVLTRRRWSPAPSADTGVAIAHRSPEETEDQ